MATVDSDRGERLFSKSMCRRSGTLFILLVLAAVQVGLAHAAVCAQLMTPGPAPVAGHCHQPSPAPPACHDMAGCSDLCDALGADWAVSKRDKGNEANPLANAAVASPRACQTLVWAGPEICASPSLASVPDISSPPDLYLSTGAFLI